MTSNQPKWVLGVASVLLVLGIVLATLREYNQQLNSAKADGSTTAQTQCMADTNAALLASTQQALATKESQLKTADLAVAELRQQKQQTEDEVIRLQGEIKYVTSTWLPPGKKAPEPLPHCVYTHGFVRVYNNSISPGAGNSTAGVPATVSATGTEGAAETATTADPSLQASHIRQADILQHITRYGSRCQNIETQLNQLLDYLEKQQGTKG